MRQPSGKKINKKKGIERFKSGNRFVLGRNKEINDLGNLLDKLGSNLICAFNDSWGGFLKSKGFTFSRTLKTLKMYKTSVSFSFYLCGCITHVGC